MISAALAYVTPAPLPAPTTCAKSHVSPRLLDRVPLNLTPDALPNDDYRYVAVIVRLDARGRIRRATIFRKSGAPRFDAEVLKAAKASHYAPEIEDCRAVPSGYSYVVETGSGTPAPYTAKPFVNHL